MESPDNLSPTSSDIDYYFNYNKYYLFNNIFNCVLSLYYLYVKNKVHQI
jgi:hypothetical protein